MRRLRAECDWKAAQTHRSLARYLLEETHETLEAIDTGEPTATEHLREELGDLLLQVYFHAVIAEESGAFTFDDVAADIVAKLRRRNPHVFGTASASGAGRGQRAVGADQGRREAAATRSPTGSRPACPRCCTPTRCSPGSSVGPARRGRPASDDVGDRLLALVAEARADGIDPSRRCATPYAAWSRRPGCRPRPSRAAARSADCRERACCAAPGGGAPTRGPPTARDSPAPVEGPAPRLLRRHAPRGLG